MSVLSVGNVEISNKPFSRYMLYDELFFAEYSDIIDCHTKAKLNDFAEGYVSESLFFIRLSHSSRILFFILRT